MFKSVFIAMVLCSQMSAAVIDDSGEQEVKESIVYHSCCDPLRIVVEEYCRQVWIANEETIARINDLKKDCIAPCKKDDDGEMKISECVDCTAHKVYKNGSFTWEERIHYKAQPCQRSQPPTVPHNPANSATLPQPKGCVVLLLVALVIIGFCTNY